MMPAETISERIKSLYFSASELKQITNWPDTIIEEFLNLFSNIELIGKDIDTNTDKIQYVLSPKAIHKLRDYLFKNGKVGGQEVYGGSVTGDDLSLYSNQANDGSINLGASGKTFYDEATDLLNVNGVQFDLTPSSTTIEEGKFIWSADDNTLLLGLPGEKSYVEVGQSMTVPRRVKNTSGSDMSRGQIVYISGVSGQQAVVSLAKADAEATSASTIAFLSEDIANNGNGFAIRLGILRGTTAEPVDTSAYATGNILYLSAATAGAFTNTKPAAPNHAVLVGIVWKVHASEGEILVNIVNGFELYELHDVDDTLSAPTSGELFAWNNSTSLWEQTSKFIYDFTSEKRIGIDAASLLAWDATVRNIQMGDHLSFWTFGDYGIGASQGIYYNGANWIYTQTGTPVSLFDLNSGYFVIHTQVAGTAGNPSSITVAQSLYFDYLGNLGVGIVPDLNWYTLWSVTQLGGTASILGTTAQAAGGTFNAVQNAIFNNSTLTWKYQVTDEAAMYYLTNGTIAMRVAASGTAGNNITWDTAFLLNNSGDVIVGNTAGTPYGSFNIIEDNTAQTVQLYIAGTNTTGNGIYYTAPVGSDTQITFAENLVGKWSVGNDASAGTFNIAVGSALATTDEFILNSAGTLTLLGGIIGNDSGADIDSRIEGDTEPNLFYVDAGADEVRHGNGTTTYLATDKSGDTWWVGSGTGLPYGSMYGDDIAHTVTVASSGVFYQVDGDLSVGLTNLITFQNAKELKVSKAGTYKIDWSMSVETAAANQYIEGTVMINGTAHIECVAAQELATANKKYNISGTCIHSLSADDLVSLAVENGTAANDIVVDHANLSMIMVGG